MSVTTHVTLVLISSRPGENVLQYSIPIPLEDEDNARSGPEMRASMLPTCARVGDEYLYTAYPDVHLQLIEHACLAAYVPILNTFIAGERR